MHSWLTCVDWCGIEPRMQENHEELKIFLQNCLFSSRFNQELGLQRKNIGFIRNFIAKIADRPICWRMIQRLTLRDLGGPRLGFHKDQLIFGQPDRTETVGPWKWAFDGLGHHSVLSSELPIWFSYSLLSHICLPFSSWFRSSLLLRSIIAWRKERAWMISR